jgi:hypothetical protein
MKFHNVFTRVLNLFLFGLFCDAFQIVSQSPVVPPALLCVDFLPFSSLNHFTDHYLCDPWFPYPLLNFTNQITHSV